MKIKYLLLILFALLFLSNAAFSQKNRKKNKKDKIKLITSGEGGNWEKVKRPDGEYWQKISTKSFITFQQGNTFYYCKEAYFINNKGKKNGQNKLEAIGNVRIIGDSVNVTGDELFYDGTTKIAKLRGNVVLTDKKMILKTPSLDYKMSNHTGNYFNGGVITDEGNTLTSRNGYYDKKNQLFLFTNNVIALSKDSTVLKSQNLHYSMNTKVVHTFGETIIIKKDGTQSISQDLIYETQTKEARFTKQVGTTTEYLLEGNSTYFDNLRKLSKADLNVVLTIKKDSITILGDHGTYDSILGKARVWGNVLVRAKMGADTMFLTADTLIALNSKDNNKLLAYNNVRIFKLDLQGKCDSMVYNTADSTIFLYTDPVLWTDGSQLKADSINILLVNKKINKMNMKMNSFVISEDSIHNYNQMKGKNMIAFFRDGYIRKVNVNGNAESIYFVLDSKDSILVGMNKLISSNMNIRFGEKNHMERVSAIGTPDGSFVPPHEVEKPETRLKGFKWRLEEKPKKEDLLEVRKVKLKL